MTIEWEDSLGDWKRFGFSGFLHGFTVVNIYPHGGNLSIHIHLPNYYQGERVGTPHDFLLEDVDLAKAACEKYVRLFTRRFKKGLVQSKRPKKSNPKEQP